MNKGLCIARPALSFLLAWALLIPSPKAAAQDSTETERLRERVARLEAQNEAILRQLEALRDSPDQTTGERPHSSGPEAASTVPILPASVTPAVAAPVAAGPASPPQQAQQPPVQTEGNRSDVSFYGFVRVDAIFDDSRPNAFQTPTLIRSEAAGAENRSNFTFHPRLTRIGMNYRAPAPLDSLGSARLTGRIEMDFQNGGRESRAIPRYRHAFFQLGWGPQSLIAGQNWDIISPLFPTVNADTLMWNAGNLGDRRVQLRYSYEPSSGFNLRAGLGLTGAVDGQDADANGVLDGEASTMPNFQGRLGYNAPNGKVLLGLWSHYAQSQTDTAVGGKTDFDSYSYGGDFEFRFTPQVNLKSEIWAGSHLSDFRGGIGQSFHTGTGKEIDSRGGWVELGLRAGRYGFSTGYTMDDPKNGHVASGAATENRAWYVTNQFRLAPPLTFGMDYLYWTTHFKGLNKGTDNRFNLYFIYGF